MNSTLNQRSATNQQTAIARTPARKWSIAGQFSRLRQSFAIACCVLAVGLQNSSRADEPSGSATANEGTSVRAETIQVRGRVVCLPEELHQRYEAELRPGHDHIWGFKANDGKLYTLLRGVYSDAIFMDERVREKELILRARLFPQSQVIEVSFIHSLRDGVEHDLHYYCDVCAIKLFSPEICYCCQGPVRLVEEPVVKKTDQTD